MQQGDIDANDLLVNAVPPGSAGPHSATGARNGGAFFGDSLGEPSAVEMQPMAVGYYISTAPCAGLPPWLWTQAEAARRGCPTHLRAALHFKVSSTDMNEEQLLRQPAATGAQQHKLDSPHSDDVLRHVAYRSSRTHFSLISVEWCAGSYWKRTTRCHGSTLICRPASAAAACRCTCKH